MCFITNFKKVFAFKLDAPIHSSYQTSTDVRLFAKLCNLRVIALWDTIFKANNAFDAIIECSTVLLFTTQLINQSLRQGWILLCFHRPRPTSLNWHQLWVQFPLHPRSSKSSGRSQQRSDSRNWGKAQELVFNFEKELSRNPALSQLVPTGTLKHPSCIVLSHSFFSRVLCELSTN